MKASDRSVIKMTWLGDGIKASDWLKSQSQASNWSVSEDYNILRHQGEKFSVENYEFLVAGKYFRLDDKQFP